MCPAAILGDRASGKTTFLGALYSSMVGYSTGHEDEFRFFAPPESINLMKNIYEMMMTGSFPDATVKDEVNKVQFTLGFKTLIGKIYAGSDSGLLRAWKGIRFAAYDVSGEDVQEYIDSGVASSPIIKQLLESYVVVILVDCGRMTLDEKSPNFRRMLHYDGEVAKLIVNFVTYKVQEYERQKAAKRMPHRLRVFPALVLTKTDLLQAQTLHQLGLPIEVPTRRNPEERRKFCEDLLRTFLPQTLSQLRGARVEEGAPSFDDAAYFTSYIRTVTAEGGMALPGAARILIQPATAGTSAQMDYSASEYYAFIEHFRRIADQVADYEGKDSNSVLTA